MTAIELDRPAGALRRRTGFGIPWKAVRVAAFYLVLVGIWGLIAAIGAWPDETFPSPGAVARDVATLADGGVLWRALAATMLRMALGYSLAIVIGLSVGVLMGVFRWANETVGSLVLGLQSLPSITWFPLAILWFGRSESAIVFVVLMGSVNSIAISSAAGARDIPPLLLRASRMFGGRWWQKLGYVILPAMLPSTVRGLKLGWSFAWRSLLAAELLLSSVSLGQLLSAGRERNDVSLIVAVMLVIVAIGTFVDRLVFGRMEGWVSERWGLAAR